METKCGHENPTMQIYCQPGRDNRKTKENVSKMRKVMIEIVNV